MIVIEPMLPSDWPEVTRIYQEGIETGMATFETAVPSWDQWDTGHVQSCRLVSRLDGMVVAWAALSPVSSRCVYEGVAETSIYVAASARGKGIGKQLYRALIAASEDAGFWTLQASVFEKNQASLYMHEQVGFRMIGGRERIAKLNGVWCSTVLLERRSAIVGID